MIQNILYNAVLGAAAGYITNDSAINLLFDEKKIGKIKIGGVVVNERKEFEDKISTLVEDEIINQENLKKSLQNEEFFETMKTLFSQYFNKELTSSIGDKEFLDLNNFFLSRENILNYVKHSKSYITKNIVDNITNTLELKDLIGEKQALEISENIFNEILKIAKKEEIVEEYLLNVYREVDQKSLVDITTKEPIYMLSDEISKQVPNIVLSLKTKKDLELDEILNNILKNSKVTKDFKEFENNLKEKSIEEILGAEKTAKLQKQILKLLKEYINSSKGQRNLEEISKGILNYLKELDLSILDFMSDDVRDSFYNFTRSKLPEIIEKVIIWIRKNDRKIENAIEDSINEVIQESGSIKESILRVIKRNLGDVTKKYGLVRKIIERIQENQDNQDLAKSFTKEIIEYLENTKIGDIISSVQMLNSKEVANFLRENLDKALDTTSSHIIPLNKIKLKTILPENLTEIVDGYISKEFINIKNNYIYSEKYTTIIQKEIKEKILKLKDMKVNELLKDEKYETFSKKIAVELYEAIDNKKEHIINGISMEFYRGVKEKKIDELLSESLKSGVVDKLHDDMIDKLESLTDNLERSKINDYLDKIKNIESIDEKATNIFVGGLVENLPVLMEGNIKRLVQENLVNLDNDELRDMMRDFMGKELKPLNIMGAVLGGVTGGALGTVTPISDISFLMNGAIYGSIGVLTNCIAIYGIFKPYKPNKALKIMTLGKLDTGVIPKQKEQFAKNMSKFVERKLLNKDSLEFTINERKDAIKESILKEIGKKKDKLIDKNLDDNEDVILEYIIKKSSEFILLNKEIISNIIIKDLDRLYIDELGMAELKERLKKVKITNKDGAQAVVQKEVKNFLLGNTKINSFISEEEIQKSLEENLIAYTDTFIESKLNSETMLKELNKKLRDYDSHLNMKVEDTLDVEEVFKYVKNKILNYDNIIQFIYHKIDDMFKQEFKENKKVGELFNGKLISFISENTDKISKNIISKIQDEIYRNEGSLKSYCVNELHDYLYDGQGIMGGITNMFKKVANSVIGGDELVRRIVGKSINKTVRIIQDSESEIKVIFKELLRDLENTRVSSFGLKLDSNETNTIIENIVRNKEFQNIFEGSCRSVIEFASEKTIKSYLNTIDIRNFNDIISIFKDDLLEVFINSKETFRENYKESFIEPVSKLMLDLVQENVLELRMQDLFKDIKEEEISNVSNRLYSSLIETNSFNDAYIKLVEESLASLENKKLNSIVNFEILERDIQNAIQNVLCDLEVLHKIYSKDRFVIENIKNILKNIDSETLQDILEIVLNPFVKVVTENTSEIFDSLKISELTYKEIANMENSKLHKMFNSFAGKYFTKLKCYGAFGALFAIPFVNYLLIAYFGFKGIKDNKKEKKDILVQEA